MLQRDESSPATRAPDRLRVDATDRRVAAVGGVIGALLLGVYFAAPAALGWPYDGASGSAISTYATTHQALFFGSAWLQVTGTLLCAVLFLAIVYAAGAAAGLVRLVTIASTAVLLATVVVEAAFLVAVPIAAAAGDSATALTMFTLSNGVFVSVFAMAPASATLVGLGLVILRSQCLGRAIGWSAVGLGVAFEVAGILAIWSTAGVVAGAILGAAQALWVIAAAVSLARTSADRGSPAHVEDPRRAS
jgi:hypothetical protein